MRAVYPWQATRVRFRIGTALQTRWISGTPARLAIVGAEKSNTHNLRDRTRNIGIIAHIDAGKTTTTERMLYYSGYTRRIGDVDEGSTVTDFLPAERARGITIQSAAITFHWPPKDKETEARPSHNINLIDTPGHADFTFEVLRSLRVLDGAVCILDGVAGVEAQTEKVWAQASNYRIPRLIYVNKLDREGAAFGRTVTEIGVRLHGWPAVCQIPWWGPNHTRLAGVGDVVRLQGLWWKEGSDGKQYESIPWEDLQSRDASLAKDLQKARAALVELLGEHDEQMIESFLDHNEDHLAIPAQDVIAALRRCVLRSPQTVFPVFAGASFRNVGVQPVLDAVLDLLPCPDERPSPEVSLGTKKGTLQQLLSDELLTDLPAISNPKSVGHKSPKTTLAVQNLAACALAFKVVHDQRRGVLVYVRVYSGSIARNSLLYNTNLGVVERAQRLFTMYASDAVDIQSVEAGQIGVIPGLKYARTGDTLLVCTGSRAKDGPPEPLNSLQLKLIEVPPPVFFTSVQAHSLSEERHLNESLDLLLREDPSLSLSTDEDSGQTHLSGMGELHLEIARDRLLGDFRAKGEIGSIEIGYREAVLGASESVTELFDREIAGKRARAASMAQVRPKSDDEGASGGAGGFSVFEVSDNNTVVIRHPTLTHLGKPATPDASGLPSQFTITAVLTALLNGVSAALARGPQYSFPIHSAVVEIDLDPKSQIFADSSPAAISSAARLATQSALRAAAAQFSAVLMEPVMLATISVNEADLGAVVHDISSARGGQVISLDVDGASAAEGVDYTTGVTFPGSEEEELPVVDPRKIYVPQDPFEGSPSGKYSGTEYVVAPNRQRQVVARVPLREMVGYLKHLRSLTGGRGTFVMKVDRFERMGGQRMKQVLSELRGSGGM